MKRDEVPAEGMRSPYWYMGGPVKNKPMHCEVKHSRSCSRLSSSYAIWIMLHRASSCEFTASTWKAFSPTKKPGWCGIAIISGQAL